MSSFFKKMYICLFEPRKIGFFLGEKLYKSFIHILLLALVVITPIVVELSLSNQISNTSYKTIEKYLVEENYCSDLLLKNNTLTGSEDFAFLIDEAIIFFNPSGDILEVGIEYSLFHVIEFKKDKLEVKFSNDVIYSKTYAELGVDEIDYSKINETDYIELDKVLSLINKGFNSYKISWVVTNGLIALLDVVLTTIMSALILAFMVRVVTPMLPFKFRFKGAMDAQIISLLCMLLMLLFKLEFIRYIGIITSTIYLFLAMMTIIKIEIRRTEFGNKENKDKEE